MKTCPSQGKETPVSSLTHKTCGTFDLICSYYFLSSHLIRTPAIQLSATAILSVTSPDIWIAFAPSAVCGHRHGLAKKATLEISPRLVIAGLLGFKWGNFPVLYSQRFNWHENMLDLEDLVALEFQFVLFNEVAQLWG